MHCVMSKLQDIPFKYFAVSLTELNNYLPILPSSRATKKIPPEELNDILQAHEEWQAEECNAR